MKYKSCVAVVVAVVVIETVVVVETVVVTVVCIGVSVCKLQCFLMFFHICNNTNVQYQLLLYFQCL